MCSSPGDRGACRLTGLLVLLMVGPMLALSVVSADVLAEGAPAEQTLDPLLQADARWRDAAWPDAVEVLLVVDGPPAFDLWSATGGLTAGGRSPADPHAPNRGEDGGDERPAAPHAPGSLRAAGHPGLSARSPEARLLSVLDRRVADRQRPIIEAVHVAGGAVLARHRVLLNAVHVRAPKSSVLALSNHPGVQRVLPVPELQKLHPTGARHSSPTVLASTVPHIGADEAEALGLTGRDVRIGIIDSGVDYTHRALGGSRLSYGANDPDVVESGSFPNDKVVGGYDFAGSDYSGSGPGRPDPDPLDEAGHGTHVSSIAAGFPGTVAHHGVARDASIVALKVFGRRGGSNLVVDALEWTLRARMGQEVAGTAASIDVLNLSLGSPWVTGVLASLGVFERLASAGVVVVAAAGNSGPVGFITGGPAGVAGVLSVASTVGPGHTSDMVRILQSGVATDLEAVEAHPSLAPSINSVGRIEAELARMGRACPADTTQEPVAGRVALILRGTCTFYTKLRRAEEEGAVAAIVADDGRGLVPMGSEEGRVGLPAFMVSQADGTWLGDILSLAPVRGVLSPTFLDAFERSYLRDTVSGFSSRGPTRGGLLKPDVAAPGTAIEAAAIGSGAGAVSQSGTSMASPVAAGAAALLVQRERQRRAGPSLTPADIAAQLVNTAAPAWHADARDGRRAALARAGNGRLDVGRAARSQTVARAGDLAGIHLGFDAFSARHEEYATVTVRNLASEARRYRVSVEWLDPDDGAPELRWSVPTSLVRVEPRSERSVTVEMLADSTGMRPYGLADGNHAMNATGRLHEAEYDAQVVIEEVDAAGESVVGGDRLTVPAYWYARGASDLTVGVGPGDDASDVRLHMTNRGGQPGSVHAFVPVAQHRVDGRVPGWLDVDHVGVRVVEGADPGSERSLEFLIHMREARRVPYDRMVELRLDTDRDGRADWVVGMDDAGFLASGGIDPAWSGRLVTTLSRSGQRAARAAGFAGVDVNGRWIVLRVDPAEIGFAAGDAVVFDADLMLGARFGAAANETVGRIGADPLHFDSGAAPFVPQRWNARIGTDGGADEIPVEVVRGDAEILLLFPDNEVAEDVLRLALQPVATVTPLPDAGPSPEPSPTATRTASPTVTSTSVATTTPEPPSPTVTPQLTMATPAPASTSTPTGTTPTATQTPTAVPSVTWTATPTPSTAPPIEGTPSVTFEPSPTVVTPDPSSPGGPATASPTSPSTGPTEATPTQLRPTRAPSDPPDERQAAGRRAYLPLLVRRR